jgi:hypothetical protein
LAIDILNMSDRSTCSNSSPYIDLPIRNVALADGITYHRGIPIHFGAKLLGEFLMIQPSSFNILSIEELTPNPALRVTFLWSNAAIQNAQDCQPNGSSNSTSIRYCSGALSSVFDPEKPDSTFSSTSGPDWNGTDWNPHDHNEVVTFGSVKADFHGHVGKVDLPLEVWSDPKLDLENRTASGLGYNSC